MTDTPMFNPSVTSLTIPPISAVQQWAKAYTGRYGPLIDLAQAVPGYPPHEDLLNWLAEASGDASTAGYGDIEGEPILREAYARQLCDVYEAQICQSNVHITAGCNQAFVAAIMTVAEPNDSVLLMEPFYFNHQSSLAMLGISPEPVTCRVRDGFMPTVDAVRQAIHSRVKAVVLVSPNNPTGAVYSPDLITNIYDLCRQNNIWLLLDETYRDFLSDGMVLHDLLSRTDWENHFIQLYSFSKSFCIPGHRLGAITAGSQVVAQIAKVMDNLQICAPRSPQVAIGRALPALPEWRKANRDRILSRSEVFKETMASVPRWQIASMGAYFAYVEHPFVDKRSDTVAEDLATRLGIATVPGEFFGESQSRYLRVAFANAGFETIRMLDARLGHLYENQQV